MGWTKAKHASAMIVTTVAQLLTKLRLISTAIPLKLEPIGPREHGTSAAFKSCTFARCRVNARLIIGDICYSDP
jgi:hypothetical protein